MHRVGKKDNGRLLSRQETGSVAGIRVGSRAAEPVSDAVLSNHRSTSAAAIQSGANRYEKSRLPSHGVGLEVAGLAPREERLN